MAAMLLLATSAFADGYTTYYGRKSTGDPMNPCRGLTTRVCARVYVPGGGNGGGTNVGGDKYYDGDFPPPILGGNDHGIGLLSTGTEAITRIVILPADTPYCDYITMKQCERTYPGLKVIWEGESTATDLD